MLTKEEVLKIAKLSKLEFNEEELVDMEKSLNEIFDYIKQINEVDVTGVEPLYNVLELKDRTRQDIVNNTEKKEDFLANAPKKDEEFVILPKIV
ncbi:Asp-tRNA(Asn)/Glu-tRNA(Gln) amidotransferase subunit GatC [Sneathia vaginalis]|uniref:Asp-tRNA(Asn)/Glu-tRNA(Gln) amidotransferase subunit GatC n=1 Tax=Sneathia vaginalis TaxID=187101 RepID=UPI0035C6BED8